MRELKFRVWDKIHEKYREPMVYDISNEKIVVRLPIETLKKGEFLLEQYTGLKDKNGKEIYEGDIVDQFVCGVHQFKGESCGRRTIWQVRWNEEECCFELHYLYGSLFGDSMMSKGEEYVVVGNIHENPELLEEE